MYEPQHLHPVAILNYLFKNFYKLLQALLPFIVFVASNPSALKWALILAPVLVVIYIAYAIINWARFVFYIQDEELRIEYGVLVKQKRYIPLERIQSIQITAGVIQRIFGVVELQVETAGGGEDAEVSLTALSHETADEIRQLLQVSEVQTGENDIETPQRIYYKLSNRDLLIVASTSNGIGVVLSGLAALLSQLDEVFSELDLFKQMEAYAADLISTGMTVIIITVLFLLIVAWVLSLMGTIITMGRFELIREGDHLKINRGLLERKQLSIPIKRIQAIKIIDGIFRQPFGFVSLEVISAGYSGEEKGGATTLYPLLPRNKVSEFLAELIPEFAVDLEVENLPQRSINRYLLVNILPALIAASVIAYLVPLGYLAFLTVPLAAVLGYMQYRDAGWKIETNKLILRSRKIGRTTAIIPQRRIQSVNISQNYWQKRHNLGNLEVSTASSVGGTDVYLAAMDKADIYEIIEWFKHLTGKNKKIFSYSSVK